MIYIVTMKVAAGKTALVDCAVVSFLSFTGLEDIVQSTRQFRVSLTVGDFEKAVAFYQEVLGLPVENDWSSPQGRCVVLSVEKATIEIIDRAQAALIDSVEVGERISGQVRFAFEFSNLQSSVDMAKATGAQVIHGPVKTPWKDTNARLIGPDGMQMTFFQSPAERGPA
jgi:predicted enzyme related to lactoylglutathione lyase